MFKSFNCLFVMLLFCSCFTTRTNQDSFFLPEPCSLISKDDITAQYEIMDPQEIRISVSISMSVDSKLCAYGWEDDSKQDYILDLFISGQEDLKKTSPYGSLDFYIRDQQHIEVLTLGDKSVYIPAMDGGETSRLAVIKGDYAIDMQSVNISRPVLLEFAEIAIKKLP